MADTATFRGALKSKLDGCVQTGKITLSSGRETDFYFDGRQVTLDPEGSFLIGSLFLPQIQALRGDAVGGITSGADPIVSSIGILAFQKGVPLKLFYVRKEPKGHGTRKLVEGPELPSGVRAVLVDDVLTTGGSLLEARDGLRQDTGIEAVAAVVVVDREEGGRENLEAEGLEVRSLFTRADFMV